MAEPKVWKMGIFSRGRLFCPLKGFAVFFTTQNSARLVIIMSVLIVGLGWWLGVKGTDWLWIIISLSLAWGSELLNTAIESACNAVTLEENHYIEIAKDVGAAAVMFFDIVMVIIVAVIYYPYLIRKFPAIF